LSPYREAPFENKKEASGSAVMGSIGFETTRIIDPLQPHQPVGKSWGSYFNPAYGAGEALAGIYEAEKKCAADFINNIRIVFDEPLPRWN
jgi:hypothetical protein